MKKRIFAILFAVMLCFTTVLPASADEYAEEMSIVVDAAELLSDSEENALTEKLTDLGDEYKLEFAVVTILQEDLYDETAMSMAKYLYKELGYGYGDTEDGMMILYVPGEVGEREICVVPFGKAKEIPEDTLTDIRESMVDDLSAENYYDAFIKVLPKKLDKACDNTFNMNVEWYWIPIAIAGGFIIALIITAVQLSALKSVRKATNAGHYVRQGSFNLNDRQDIFLYRNVRKVAKPKDSSSSSGGSSGGSTKF